MAGVNDDIISQYLQEIFSDRDGIKRVLEVLLNAVMKGELSEHINAEDYQRSSRRSGHRNGYKKRTLATRVGRLDLEVPQARNCAPYHPSMIECFQRSERALLCACAEMYFQGVSTRKVQEVLQDMCGMEISSATVSVISAEIDEKLETFGRRSLLAQEYPFIMIDARYEKIRVNGSIVSRAVLVAVGITESGSREVLDWRIGDSESEDTWGRMLRDLKQRGLRGVEMIISDAHGGIRAAIAKHLQGVAWQRCRVHFMRELLNKFSWKKKKQLASEISLIFKGQSKRECLELGRESARKYPEIAKFIEAGLEDTLAVMDLPEEFRSKLASTNMIESIMKRLKARTRVVQIFPNDKACWRLVGAGLMELHEDWLSAERPYLKGMEHYYLTTNQVDKPSA